jgi:hypothetical protein
MARLDRSAGQQSTDTARRYSPTCLVNHRPARWVTEPRGAAIRASLVVHDPAHTHCWMSAQPLELRGRWISNVCTDLHRLDVTLTPVGRRDRVAQYGRAACDAREATSHL